MSDRLGANSEETDGIDHFGGGSFEDNNEQNEDTILASTPEVMRHFAALFQFVRE